MGVAQGPGPRWFRVVLAVVAALYLVALVKHPPAKSVLKPIAFFTEATSLFPSADNIVMEFRLEAWSCTDRRWVPLDPRPYFPIEANDKESRFQRLAYFIQRDPSKSAHHANQLMLNALDDYIVANHPDVDDSAPGPIGGIRLFKIAGPIPTPGDPVVRYVYQPLVVPEGKRTGMYNTRASIRKKRCGTGDVIDTGSASELEP